MCNKQKIYESIVYIHNIKLTTSEDIPYMYKSIYTINPNIYIKFRKFYLFNYNKKLNRVIWKLEEEFLIELIHRNFPHIPKKFNKLIGYNYSDNPSNIKKIINCINE